MFKSFENLYGIERVSNKMLNRYVNLIIKNQNRLNLIGKSTIPNIWERHVVDSMQIFNYLPKEKKTAAQLLLFEKMKLSHRGKALQKIQSDLFCKFQI